MKKILFLSLMVLATEKVNLVAPNLLHIARDGISLKNEELQTYVNKKAKQYVSLHRENAKAMKKKIKKNFSDIFPSHGDSSDSSSDSEESNSENIDFSDNILGQHIFCEVFKNFYNECPASQKIGIPTSDELFKGSKNNKISDQDMKKIKTIKFMKDGEDINTLQLKHIHKNIQDVFKNFSKNEFIAGLNTFIAKMFDFYGLNHDFTKIAITVFHKSIKNYCQKKSRLELTMADVFDIAMYIRYQMSQWDQETELFPDDEKAIVQGFGKNFSIFRQQAFESNSQEAQKFQEDLWILNKNSLTEEKVSTRISYIVDQILHQYDIKSTMDATGRRESTKELAKIVVKKTTKTKTLRELAIIINKNNEEKETISSQDLFYAFLDQFFNNLHKEEKIIPVIKFISLNCVFTFLSEKYSAKSFKNLTIGEMIDVMDFIKEHSINTTKNYDTTYHEAAHAFIALDNDISVNFASSIKDHRGSLGFISPGKIQSHWIEMKIDVAGILGGFITNGKLNNQGARSDFESAIKGVESLNTALINNEEKVLKKQCGKNETLEDFKKKMNKHKRKGLKMLENCKAFKDVTLEDFFTPTLWKKIKDNEEYQNLIAACIVETFKKLTEDLGNKNTFKILAEKFYDHGALTNEEMRKYLEPEFDNDMMLNYYIPAQGNYFQGRRCDEKKELKLHDNRKILPFHFVPHHEIQQENQRVQRIKTTTDKWVEIFEQEDSEEFIKNKLEVYITSGEEKDLRRVAKFFKIDNYKNLSYEELFGEIGKLLIIFKNYFNKQECPELECLNKNPHLKKIFKNIIEKNLKDFINAMQ